MKSRDYRMTARAESAEATGERIRAAARARFRTTPYDELTLADVAADAGVTVQTVLRRFGSKDGLVRAVAEAVTPQVIAQRDSAPAGDVTGAVANLVEHYEVMGDEVLMLLRQELRVPVLREITTSGRLYHSQWVGRVFAPWLDGLAGQARKRRHAQLLAATDVYVWFLLRRQSGLSRRATEHAIRELVNGVLL